MTQEDIIRMALEAGFVEHEIDDGTTDAFDVRYERLDIIRMAREAGFEKVVAIHPDGSKTVTVAPVPELEAFANLVAKHEREAIAQMFEASPELISFAQNDQGGCIICGLNPKIAAKAIRARGENT